jgi:small-conductance mechanosensitive channel
MYENESFLPQEKKGDQSSPGGTYVGEPGVDTSVNYKAEQTPMSTASLRRGQGMRLEDDLQLMEAERMVSRSTETKSQHGRSSMSRTQSYPSQRVDEFDKATNPLHEKAAVYQPPESPTTQLSAFVKKVHNSSFIVRYLTYIVPVVLLLLIPLLIGALKYTDTSVGGVELMWFSIWLEIVWLTLWAARVVGKCIPPAVSIISSIFTNNAKKWRDMAKQLEVHFVLFFWWLAVEISFLPTMKNHHVDGDKRTRGWERTLNMLIIVGLVWTILNVVEKIIIQLIAITFHQRTYDDRIQLNKFQIGSLTKLYQFSRARIAEDDEAFGQNPDLGTPQSIKNPLQYASEAGRVAQRAVKNVGNKVSDVAGGVLADFTGRQTKNSSDPYQVVLALLRTISGSQVLARRLYRTFARDGFDTVFSEDLKEAFDDNEEAEAAFSMFDRDMNGDISIEELEGVCVDIGRERKSITASLKDLDSVVSKLDQAFMFFVFIIVVIVFLTLISTSTAGVLTSAGSTILALSWMFSTTATEFLQSIIFVFVKHPFDVGDRVTIYGNSGASGLGDDYFVKEIALLYTEFKKMEGHIVQAPNSVLNNLFILNQRRTGALAEAVPIVIKYGTTVDQMERLRQRLVEFVRSEKRDFQNMILHELREVTENLSLTLNVVFFYKSNWQNEGLRLQRRNKFICMLMIALQEVGIEGPRMNLQGYNVNTPFHVAYAGPPTGAPPTYQHHAPDEGAGAEVQAEQVPIDESSHNIPENTGSSSGVQQGHPILRRGIGRSRGESTHKNKHVDFSLGMSDISSNDIMGDVFEDRGSTAHMDEVVRSSNRHAAERRMQEIGEEEGIASQDGRSSADGRSVRSERSGASSTRHRFSRRRHRGSVSRERGDLESGSGRGVQE